MPVRPPRASKRSLRLSADAKVRLVQAAAECRQSLNQFVRKSALGRADEILAGRGHFWMDAGRWADFLAALDAPPRPIPRLTRLLSQPSVFERQKPE